MAMKQGLDQTTAWILAVVATGAVYGIGFGVVKYSARHAEGAAEGDEHGHEDKAEHEEHGHEERGHEEEGHEEKAEHEEHGGHEEKAEHEEHGRHEEKAEHEEHGGHEEKAEHEEHGGHEEKAKHSDKGEHGAANGGQGEGEQAGAAPWDYNKGSLGPQHWGELSPAYKSCAAGKRQSPIDITVPPANAKLLPIRFHYQEADTIVKHNGHSLQADFPRGNFVEIDGDHYDLKQLHFHAPSEHKVSGAPYDLELQLVHKDAGGHLAIIGVLFEEGTANKALAKLWTNLPSAGDTIPEPLALNPASLLPTRQLYFHYSGSLTAPPCSEDVAWYVLTEPLQVSSKQLEIFSHAVAYNARPTQPLGSRSLVRSARQ